MRYTVYAQGHQRTSHRTLAGAARRINWLANRGEHVIEASEVGGPTLTITQPVSAVKLEVWFIEAKERKL